MQHVRPARPRDVRDYLGLIRRRRGTLLGCVILGLLGAVAYLQLAPPVYVASAKVSVFATAADTAASDATTTTSEVNLDTEAQLVTSAAVSEQAADALGTDERPSQLLRHVSVTVPPNTTVLEISYTGSSGAAAQQGAQAFADAYLESRAETAASYTDTRVSRVLGEIDRTAAEIQEITDQLSGGDNGLTSAEEIALQDRRTGIEARLASLNSTLASLNAFDAEPGTVINDALVPSSPRDPNPLLVIPGGGILGLLLGAAVAGLRERRDHRVHDAADLGRLFGVTPLVTLPGSWRTDEVPRTLDHDGRLLAHTVRALGEGEPRTVLVLAPDSHPVADGVAASMADVAARSGTRTVLVSQAPAAAAGSRDSRAPTPSGYHAPEVTSYGKLGLLGGAGLRSGHIEPVLRERAGSDGFVILGMPTTDVQVDLPVLSRYVDVVVVVVVYGTTTREDFEPVVSALQRSYVQRVVVIAVSNPRGRRARARQRGATLSPPPSVPTQPAQQDGSSDPGEASSVPGGTHEPEPHLR